MTYDETTASNVGTTLNTELLRLERQYDDARAACMPGQADVDAQIAEVYRIAEEIEDEPARTPAGHTVKLRIWIDMLAVAFSEDSPVPFAEMADSIAAIRATLTA